MEDYQYVCVMFPYPSGEGLHVGHFYNYAITDSYCRYLRYQDHNVFQPFGYDAFGLPAENYAKKVGKDPKEVTQENIENFRKQMASMNTEYDEVLVTSSESYQKRTQWLFNVLKNRGLAYKADGNVNYCPSCETVLAREQVKDEKCDRCKNEVEQKTMNQWYFKITDYKDRLIDNLEKIDYPKSTINAQRNWLENLHDWCVSRQRKWGCPIPVEDETDTLDTFVDSSFYYIIYCLERGLTPKQVDLYVGGSEHACMHLIYARFICMTLFDAGIIDFEEPFKKVVHQGMILKDGEKMAKSKGNVVSPDEYDPRILRFYLMFLGPYTDGGSWNDKNIKGIIRFVNRWNTWMEKEGEETLDVEKFKKEIFEHTERLKFNRVVSSFMILMNQNKSKALNSETKKELNNLLNIYMPAP